jgi:acetyl-CoA carboxylase carboxyl transferase subunit alpha
MATFLEFEKPIAELDSRIRELQRLSGTDGMNIASEVATLEGKLDQLLTQTYKKLDAWQKTQVARHPERPHFKDCVESLFDSFTPLAGDRAFADDQALMGGLARFRGRSVMVIGHEKGDDTASRIKHNFGSARPEGYRKAIRLMKLADHFDIPVITLVDTAGAYPGIGAEERGQAEAIARSTEACLELHTPLITAIVGEGGSGGAVALATGNAVLMLEHSIYSVISPEGCASILWRDAAKASTAAQALKLTAQDLLELKIIDEIVPEPLGGAHRAPEAAMANLGGAIEKALDNLCPLSRDELKAARREKFLRIGSALDQVASGAKTPSSRKGKTTKG